MVQFRLFRSAICLLFIHCLASQHEVAAQQVEGLLQYTNEWRYDATGLNLGDAWTDPDFDDSRWPSGSGLIGWELSSPPPYPVPINTAITPASSPVITYYYRTAFSLAAAASSEATLQASIYVDDGCVLYLNGAEVARIRVPTNQTPQLPTGGTNTAVEGQRHDLVLGIQSLRVGTNVIAAAVYQSATNSSDVVWGLRLSMVTPEPIEIITSPTDQVLSVGQTNVFQVGLRGGPADLQWFKNGQPIPQATNQFLIQRAGQTNDSGTYWMTASNVYGLRTSGAARLTVNGTSPAQLDFTGPTIVSALATVVQGVTNMIDVTFSESVLPTSGAAAISVRALDDHSSVEVQQAGFPNPRAIRFRVSGSNWHVGGSRFYVATLNGVRDNSPNRNWIAPDSAAPVSWPQSVELVHLNSEWSYHVFALEDFSVHGSAWHQPGYVETEYWRRGRMPFFTPQPLFANSCLGPFQTEIPFQVQPILFRTTFSGAGLPERVTLNFQVLATDGVAAFLNGQEILREGLPARPGALDVDTRSLASQIFDCANRSLPDVKILPGINHLACAVYQPLNNRTSTVFAVTLRGLYLISTNLPPPHPPTLLIEPLNSLAARLSWQAPGFALETTTNLTAGAGPSPSADWLEVRQMTNPYTNYWSNTARFFRLRN